MTCISRFIGAALGIALMGIAGTSCERIYDDLEPCPHGVSLRFVYDYNMEFADAFPKKVDCLTVLVYDAKGTHVATHTVAGAELQDEHFRMNLDLEEGDYSFVAYGGMACERRSFDFGTLPRPGARLDELTVALDCDCLTNPDRKRLHDLYWGTLALRTADLYQEGVVKMMKNTNNIRIVLQQQHGEPVDDKDFLFEIHDDNTLFSGVDNDLIAAGPVTYTPWITGQASTGVIIVGDKAETAENRRGVRRVERLAPDDRKQLQAARQTAERRQDDHRLPAEPIPASAAQRALRYGRSGVPRPPERMDALFLPSIRAMRGSTRRSW